VLVPLPDYTDRAFAAVVKFYELERAGNVAKAVEPILGQLMNLQEFDWKKLVVVMRKRDPGTSQVILLQGVYLKQFVTVAETPGGMKARSGRKAQPLFPRSKFTPVPAEQAKPSRAERHTGMRSSAVSPNAPATTRISSRVLIGFRINAVTPSPRACIYSSRFLRSPSGDLGKRLGSHRLGNYRVAA
jgi:hypothetical protein